MVVVEPVGPLPMDWEGVVRLGPRRHGNLGDPCSHRALGCGVQAYGAVADHLGDIRIGGGVDVIHPAGVAAVADLGRVLQGVLTALGALAADPCLAPDGNVTLSMMGMGKPRGSPRSTSMKRVAMMCSLLPAA